MEPYEVDDLIATLVSHIDEIEDWLRDQPPEYRDRRDGFEELIRDILNV